MQRNPARKVERTRPPFAVGVNYWPRRTGFAAMWRDFDGAEIDEDFARIAALGLDTVRIFLRWDDVAPQIDTIDPVILERFATVVTLAGERGLRVVPTLFCGFLGGVNYLPAWSLDIAGGPGRFPTRSGDVAPPAGSGDLYGGPLLDAQLVLARAVGERLSEHPAIAAWDIGNAFTNVRAVSGAKISSGEHAQAPVTEREVAQWSARLCEALRATSRHPATAGLHAGDLLEDRNIRFASLCAPFAFASMQADTVRCGFARGRRDPEVVPFLALLTAAFSFKPVLVTSFGAPTCPPGKFSAFERFAAPGEPPNLTISPDDTVFATYPCLTEDENATYCTAVLERLHADGRLGALWWCWSDDLQTQRSRPPGEREPVEESYGIIRADGSEKPVAAALSAFARQGRTVVRARDMPMIADTYYYRTLPTSTSTLFEAFLGTLDARRGTPEMPAASAGEGRAAGLANPNAP